MYLINEQYSTIDYDLKGLYNLTTHLISTKLSYLSNKRRFQIITIKNLCQVILSDAFVKISKH